MQPYIYIFTFSLICALCSCADRKLDRFISAILFIVIFLFIGLRYDSVDYFGYWSIYNDVEFSGLSGFNKEKGFAFLNLIEQKLTGDFFYFVFFFSLASIWIKYSALKKMVPLVSLALFIYVSTELFWKDLGQIRNGFVAGMMMYAVYFAQQKKLIKFSLIVFLASQIHMVALIGILIYFADRLSSKRLMLTILLGSFLVAMLGGIGHTLISKIPIDSLGKLSYRAHSYIDGKYDVNKNIFGLNSLISLALMIVFIFYYNYLIKVSQFNYYFVPVAVIGLSFAFLFADYSIIGGRINNIFYLPSLIILLSSLYDLVKGQQRIFVVSGIIIYCVVSFIYSYITATHPYQTIF